MSHQIGRSRLLQFALILAAGFLLFINSASAQTGTASIVGTVSDPNGAVVPAAKVSIKNVDTNQEFVLSSDSAGAYVAACRRAITSCALQPPASSPKCAKESF